MEIQKKKKLGKNNLNKKQENIDAKHQWRRESVVSEIEHITAGYILNIPIEYFYNR